MSDNLFTNDDAPYGSAFALPDIAVVAFDGPDATTFAQAQFANDVTLLEPGHWQWNTWLNAKGRVLALFALVKVSDDHLRVLLLDGPADPFVDALKRLLFRRKLTIEKLNDARVLGAFDPPRSASGNKAAIESDVSIELDFGASSGPRRLIVGFIPFAAPEQADVLNRWRAFDLAHGLPRLPHSEYGQWTPQQLSLERLHAFSVKKGCYPGQEIVARTHFLGKAKRGLTLIESANPIAVGDEVQSAGLTVGRVVATATAHGQSLAVVPQPPPESLEHRGASVKQVPLGDGLAR